MLNNRLQQIISLAWSLMPAESCAIVESFRTIPSHNRINKDYAGIDAFFGRHCL